MRRARNRLTAASSRYSGVVIGSHWTGVVLTVVAACYDPADDAACTIACSAANPACPGDLVCLGNLCAEPNRSVGCAPMMADAAVDSVDAVDAFADPLAACPSDYDVMLAGGRYRLVFNVLSDWPAAENLCEMDSLGGQVFTHLAVIGSAAEQLALAPNVTARTWVGYTDMPTDGAWHHVTGESAAYPGNGPGTMGWTGTEPNGGASENCAVLENGGLRDVDCLNGGPGDLPRLCECDLRMAP